MNILVTGGAGYIGSHTCVALLQQGHSVIVADNFYNSNLDNLTKVTQIVGKETKVYEIDVTNSNSVNKIFIENKIDAVMHFAGFKSVGESVLEPLLYYQNNLVSTMNLINACLKYKVSKFIFSSSATVYGENISPLKESLDLLPTANPYGETKAMTERMLTDVAKANPFLSVGLLRYFNPIGAHKSGLIGESPNNTPNNLMPYITQVAKGRLPKLNIYGADYPTEDGTGVRDYVHVMDIAEGHVATLNNLKEGVNIYNLGTGIGTSVLELIRAFEKVSGIKIPYKIVERRTGDLPSCFAEVTKANNELGWKATRNIYDMCRDAWRFEKNKL